MADDKPPRRPDREIDEQVTSSFPADGLRRELAGLSEDDESTPSGEPRSHDGSGKPAVEADADSWVDQWSSLFPNDGPGGTAQPTREMPVYSAEQPPLTEQPSSQDRMPGHLDPSVAARKKRAERQAKGRNRPADRDETHAQDPPRAEAADEQPSEEDQDRAEGGDAAEILAWQRAQERTKRRAKLRANQRKAKVIQRQRPGHGAAGAEQQAPPTEPVGRGQPVLASPRSMPTPSHRGSGVGGYGGPAAARDRGSDGGRRPTIAIAVGVVLFTGAAVVIGYLLTGFGLRDDEVAATGDGQQVDLVEADEGFEVGADVTPRGISELALSTVQLVGLDDDLEPQCAGSGVIVKSDGTILTNAHVVTSEGGCQFTSIGIGVTVDSTSPAELLYRAEVLAVDRELDLAVLKISSLLEPDDGASLPETFPQAPLGDSDTVELGDNVRILGYPVIGGDTITLTTGTVSGFTSQAAVGARALIKTDATIAAGNSGGLAVDPDGRVIGIPTKARASESGPAIDCRALNDTNSDGAVDDQDNCVPVGGFLNGVRPINLALPLLDEAASANPLGAVVTADESDQVASKLDFENVVIENPRFALGQRRNLPVNEIVTTTAGIPELCFFVDWSGIPVGTNWDGAWFLDGELEPALGFIDQLWSIEEDGRNFWLCARERNEAGLAAGVYEIGFFIEGDLMFAEGIELTEEPVEMFPVTWTNDTDGEICELRVNPFSRSGQVGLNELDEGVTIPPGDSRTIDLPLGKVIVEAYNCEGEPVADAFAGLEISGEATFLIGL